MVLVFLKKRIQSTDRLRTVLNSRSLLSKSKVLLQKDGERAIWKPEAAPLLGAGFSPWIRIGF